MNRRPSSLKVSCTIVFGALSVLLTLLKGFTTFPFPVLTYLKFELAEIPCVLVYMLMGFKPGLASAVIYWAVLTPIGEFTPIGPAMKFAALGSLIVGMETARRLFNAERLTGGKLLLSAFAVGAVLRIAIMTVFNYVVLAILFPEFLSLASIMLKAAGLNPSGWMDTLTITLMLTGLFNLLHSGFSTALSHLIVKALLRVKPKGFLTGLKPSS